MNWMSLPYECVRGARECPKLPQGNRDGTTGTYGLYRTFGEQNKEQLSSAPVGSKFIILDNAKYIKAVSTLALAVASTYLY